MNPPNNLKNLAKAIESVRHQDPEYFKDMKARTMDDMESHCLAWAAIQATEEDGKVDINKMQTLSHALITGLIVKSNMAEGFRHHEDRQD